MRTSGKAFLISPVVKCAICSCHTHAACTTKQISRIGPMDLGHTREHDGLATACRARGLGEPGGGGAHPGGGVGRAQIPRSQESATTLSQDRALASAPGRACIGCPCAVPTLSASLVLISSSDHRSLTPPYGHQRWPPRWPRWPRWPRLSLGMRYRQAEQGFAPLIQTRRSAMRGTAILDQTLHCTHQRAPMIRIM
jgi:hypothetical protein